MIISANKFYTLNQMLYSCDGIVVCCWLVKLHTHTQKLSKLLAE